MPDTRSERTKEIDRRVMARVKQGQTLLQQEYGDDWVDHINMRSLDLSDGMVCVLGQVCSSYGRGVTHFFGDSGHDDDSIPTDHGFYVYDGDPLYVDLYERGKIESETDYYKMLDEGWKRAIRNTRERRRRRQQKQPA